MTATRRVYNAIAAGLKTEAAIAHRARVPRPFVHPLIHRLRFRDHVVCGTIADGTIRTHPQRTYKRS